MTKLFQKIIFLVFIGFISLMIAQCGGGSSSSNGGSINATTAQEDAGSLAKTTMDNFSTAESNSSISSARLEFLYTCTPITVDCTVSGTFGITCSANGGSLVFDMCDQGSDIFIDGTITFATTTSGTETTSTIEYVDFLLRTDNNDLTMNGTSTLVEDTATNESTISFENYGATSSTGDSFSISSDGLTLNTSTNLLNGVMSFTIDVFQVTCTFVDFPIDSSTAAYQGVCTT